MTGWELLVGTAILDGKELLAATTTLRNPRSSSTNQATRAVFASELIGSSKGTRQAHESLVFGSARAAVCSGSKNVAIEKDEVERIRYSFLPVSTLIEFARIPRRKITGPNVLDRGGISFLNETVGFGQEQVLGQL